MGIDPKVAMYPIVEGYSNIPMCILMPFFQFIEAVTLGKTDRVEPGPTFAKTKL